MKYRTRIVEVDDAIISVTIQGYEVVNISVWDLVNLAAIHGYLNSGYVDEMEVEIQINGEVYSVEKPIEFQE